jgi:DNA-binding response OmpR family regulator
MLPGTDGLTLSKSVRSMNASVPVLLLTAKSMIDDKLEGFRSGADDYITKPFHMDELVYRMEVFFKRSKSQDIPGHQFIIGKYEFNYHSLELKIDHQQKSLTQREADVLRLLCLEKDRVIKREEILKTVWGDDDYFMGRSLDVFISKLRKYLKDDPSVEIVNYHGIGFKLQFN